MNRIEKAELLAAFMGVLRYRPTEDFIEYAPGQGCNLEDAEYHRSWDWLIPVIQKIIRNHEDEVVSVKQNLPKEVIVEFELDLDTLLYDFEFSYVLSKDVSEVYDKVVELVQILKENELW